VIPKIDFNDIAIGFGEILDALSFPALPNANNQGRRLLISFFPIQVPFIDFSFQIHIATSFCQNVINHYIFIKFQGTF